MSGLQITAIALCFTIPLLGWALLFRTLWRMAAVFRTGRPDPTRTDQPFQRTKTLLVEFFGHTRMSRLRVVAVAHWFTALSFLILFLTLVNAFWQLVWADFTLPLIGHFPPYEWLTELFAWGGFFGIITLIVIRQQKHPRASDGEHGRRSRFFGSSWWQAYYVEATILLVTICILTLRSLEYTLAVRTGAPNASLLHFPLTAWMAFLWTRLDAHWVRESIYVVAAAKIMISFAWMIVVSVVPTMGVAWHRFLAFPNIWFKRFASGRTALGAAKPLMRGGETVTLADVEAMDDDTPPPPTTTGLGKILEPLRGTTGPVPIKLGVERIEDFTWKGLLDFSTCTECGRCQSQCPAWNTEKPLSPKLLMMTLRDHAHAKAPFLLATEDERRALPSHITNLATVPLVGDMGYDPEHPTTAYDAIGPNAIVDPDVLWSCTTCGACVEQCPVDIEHVDHILDLRRHQVMMESAFPAEFGGLFKQLETKGNPWGMAPTARLDWAQGLDFPIKLVGDDVTDLTAVDYLFWVGCAGAYEDRAKKTTRAVAELLHMAGVDFAVLGNGETCTGDSARRAGNEILFMMLAEQNVTTLNEAKATKIVVTCAHCFNTLRNEYPQFGGQFDVIHHTQLLNRLVREKKLVPVTRPTTPVPLGMPDAASGPLGANATAGDAAVVPANAAAGLGHGVVTYHDPCYLGRHNHVYAPPRELIGALPGVELKEMPRHGLTSFCCGAGGARMWAEEKLGSRINVNRTTEAVETGADRIAVGCPFCRVMLSDGVTAAQAEGTARAEVEVVDVAQMLLAAVQPLPTTPSAQPLADADAPTEVIDEPLTQRVAMPGIPPHPDTRVDAPEPPTSVTIPRQEPSTGGYLSAVDGAHTQPSVAGDAAGHAATPADVAAPAGSTHPDGSDEAATDQNAGVPQSNQPGTETGTTVPESEAGDVEPVSPAGAPGASAARATSAEWAKVTARGRDVGTLASSEVMALLGVASATAPGATHEEEQGSASPEPSAPMSALTSTVADGTPDKAPAPSAPAAAATTAAPLATPATTDPPPSPVAPKPQASPAVGSTAGLAAPRFDGSTSRDVLRQLAADAAGSAVPAATVLQALHTAAGTTPTAEADSTNADASGTSTVDTSGASPTQPASSPTADDTAAAASPATATTSASTTATSSTTVASTSTAAASTSTAAPGASEPSAHATEPVPAAATYDVTAARAALSELASTSGGAPIPASTVMERLRSL